MPAAAEWAQYESEHFEFRTEQQQIVAVDMLRQLEYLHWSAGQYLGVPERSGAKPGRFEILDLSEWPTLDRRPWGPGFIRGSQRALRAWLA